MPKRKAAPKRSNDVPVRLDAEVVRKARIVAGYRDQGIAEYLSETLGETVERHLQEHARETLATSPPATNATRPLAAKKGGGGKA